MAECVKVMNRQFMKLENQVANICESINSLIEKQKLG